MHNDEPPRGLSLKAMEREISTLLKIVTVDYVKQTLTENLVIYNLILSRRYLTAWVETTKESGEPPPGRVYGAEMLAKMYLSVAVLIDAKQTGVAERLRANLMKSFLTRHDHAPDAYIALERACVAAHQKSKAEKGHRNSLKALYGPVAVERWQAYREKFSSKIEFSLDFSARLWREHGLKIDYRTIAEVWLKGQ